MDFSSARPTWEQLVALEPRLGDLLARCQRIKSEDENDPDPPDPHFCRNHLWAIGRPGFPRLKGEMNKLVGFGSKHPEPIMHTCAAWDVAMEVLLDALPACRACGCAIVDHVRAAHA